MNILIVDTEQIDFETANKMCEELGKKEEIFLIPKGIDIIQDVSTDWMIMIRNELNRRIDENNKRRI